MKKLFSIILIVLLLFGLTSCKHDDDKLPQLNSPFEIFEISKGAEALYDKKNNQVVTMDGLSVDIYFVHNMQLRNTIEVISAEPNDSISVFDVNDGFVAVAIRKNKKIDIYDLSTFELVKVINTQNIITTIKLDGDKIFYSANGDIYLLNWKNGKDVPQYLLNANSSFILGKDNTIYASNYPGGYDGKLTVYDYVNEKILYEYRGMYSSSIAFPFFDGVYLHYIGRTFDIDNFTVFSENGLSFSYTEHPDFAPEETLYHSDEISLVQGRVDVQTGGYLFKIGVYDMKANKFIHIIDYSVYSLYPVIKISDNMFFLHNYHRDIAFLDISKI